MADVPKEQWAQVIEKTGGPVEYKKIPVQQPGPDEVLVNIKYSGVCHTDLHAVNGDWPLPTKLPLVGGHEGAGVVVAKGELVHDIEIGDHAGVKWINGSCLQCDFCQQSDEPLCGKALLSGYTVDGSFQQYCIAKAAHVARLHKDIPLDAVAPVLCAGITVYKGLKESGAKPGQTVAIVGAGGGLGSLAQQYAKAMGLRTIAIDSGDEKKKMCLEQLGSYAFVDFATSQNVVKDVQAATEDGLGPHAVILVAVNEKPFQQAAEYVRPRGTVICIGLPAGAYLRAPVFESVIKMVTIRGSYVGNRKDSAEALEFFRRGVIKAPFKTVAHFKILVPSAAAGAIIGKGGITIAQLQKDAGARVKMSKASEFYPGTTERVCLVSGPVDGILKIHDFIMEKISEKPPSSSSSPVSSATSSLESSTESTSQLTSTHFSSWSPLPASTTNILASNVSSSCSSSNSKSSSFSSSTSSITSSTTTSSLSSLSSSSSSASPHQQSSNNMKLGGPQTTPTTLPQSLADDTSNANETTTINHTPVTNDTATQPPTIRTPTPTGTTTTSTTNHPDINENSNNHSNTISTENNTSTINLTTKQPLGSSTLLINQQLHEIRREKQVKILVPNSTAGMIIGKGGSYIKQIKEESGAYVQISQKSVDVALPERCVTVIGDLDNNRKACSMILSKIVEDIGSGNCLNINYSDVSGPVANFNPTGSPYANTTHSNSFSNSSSVPFNISTTTNNNNINNKGNYHNVSNVATTNHSLNINQQHHLQSQQHTINNGLVGAIQSPSSLQSNGTGGVLAGSITGIVAPAIITPPVKLATPPLAATPTGLSNLSSSIPASVNSAQMIESIKTMLRISGYGEDAVSEITSAVSTLASYGVLSILGVLGLI